MSVQIVEIAGQKMAMLPMDDYERLLELAEDRADIMAAQRAEARRMAGEEYVPAELVNRILDGESPLRVWRQHRKLTLERLAHKAGLSVSYLSDLERGKRQGKGVLWRRLAEALGVSVDDILPDE
jgi:DNA-binding XRE family transcriptional regulator